MVHGPEHFCIGESAKGHQKTGSSARLDFVVAVVVLVSSLVSIWCPKRTEIESTAAKR
jgi:hypothetical protein